MQTIKKMIAAKLAAGIAALGAANALTDFNFNASYLALKGTEHKLAPFHQIKARPVYVCHRLPNEGGRVGKIGNQMGHTVNDGRKRVTKITVISHSQPHSLARARFL